MSRQNAWDPGLYDTTHHYVTDYGKSLLALLAPQAGERILDVGCGTGHLTHQIADSGAEVVGIDSSPEMIAQARQNYPRLQFHLASALDFHVDQPFHAVFSNAVLHWVKPPEKGAAMMRAALDRGGRLVVEFGGRGNIASILAAAGRNPWYFPSIGEYASVLESQGFEVTSALLFERPTQVDGEDGLQQWLTMFFKPPLTGPELTRMADELRPQLYRDGAWFIDYKRLRITAIAR